MPSEKDLQVKTSGSGLTITGLALNESEGEWQAKSISDRWVLARVSDPEMAGDTDGFAYCRLEVLISTLFGFVARHFTGVISVGTDDAVKRLYFKDGRLVFASSNLIDDRLGEVIYRAGMITLEQMTEAAVQVNRTTKFGKVLIDSQDFSSADLWEALKLQVYSIFQSIFLYESVYYQIESGQVSPPTTVIFEDSMEKLIEEGASFGQMFRSFLSRLNPNSDIYILHSSENGITAKEGTFLGDMVQLMHQSPQVADVAKKSKLIPLNTYVALFDLVHSRIIEIKHMKENKAHPAEATTETRELKSLIDAYHVLLGAAKKAFESENLSFPLQELHIFLGRKYRLHKSPLFLHGDGSIAPESVSNIYARGRNSRSQQKIMIGHLQSLVQFLLQVTGDLLPEKGWSTKKSFQEMLLT
jgi:hypothetical protein